MKRENSDRPSDILSGMGLATKWDRVDKRKKLKFLVVFLVVGIISTFVILGAEFPGVSGDVRVWFDTEYIDIPVNTMRVGLTEHISSGGPRGDVYKHSGELIIHLKSTAVNFKWSALVYDAEEGYWGSVAGKGEVSPSSTGTISYETEVLALKLNKNIKVLISMGDEWKSKGTTTNARYGEIVYYFGYTHGQSLTATWSYSSISSGKATRTFATIVSTMGRTTTQIQTKTVETIRIVTPTYDINTSLLRGSVLLVTTLALALGVYILARK